MCFISSLTAPRASSGSLRSSRQTVLRARTPPRPRARRKDVATRAFFDSGAAGSGDNNNGNSGNSGPQQQRATLQSLVALLLSIPSRLDRYYSPRNPLVFAFRRTMWCVISGGAGFYAGNIVTLSFGALAINDVFAGVVTLLFYEVVTKLFYSKGSLSKRSLKMWFVNYFKMGVVLSCLADAIKLGG